MDSIPVSVTLISLVDIYFLLDRIKSLLTLLTFNDYNVYDPNLSNTYYHIG